ncbi:hypothetical protein O9649_28240 [Achromobacter dolens]|uniref:hypothetical protein n=1 Tax=Achromobacter dolens TaxID=1287738 RepID=UPI0022B8CA86|nr:hypothetical protein [Achromobacter dolens]MCZ8411687.1 hypothetical protein [Achromobacter dolens]
MSSIANDRTAPPPQSRRRCTLPLSSARLEHRPQRTLGHLSRGGPAGTRQLGSMRQAATAEAWALYATKLRSQLREQVGDGVTVSEEEEGYVRRVKEAVIFNHARVPGGFVQVRQYDLRKTMELLARLEQARGPSACGDGDA